MGILKMIARTVVTRQNKLVVPTKVGRKLTDLERRWLKTLSSSAPLQSSWPRRRDDFADEFFAEAFDSETWQQRLSIVLGEKRTSLIG